MSLRLQHLSACLTIVFLTFLLIFRGPDHASHIETYPDAVEYVSMAVNFLREGNVKLEINGQYYPSRYAPWFSLSVLAPALAIFGVEAGNAIYGTFTVNLLGMLVGYLLLARLVSPLVSLLAILTFLLIPTFSKNAQFMMTDVPSTLIGLICFCVLLKDREFIWEKKIAVILLGSLIGLATLWRITNFFFILPFLFLMFSAPKNRLIEKILFLLPLFLAIGLNFTEQYRTFQSFFRNGYNYWTSIPYDYPSLTFNWQYLSTNLRKLSQDLSYLIVLGLFLASIIIHYLRNQERAKLITIFTAFASIPCLVFYLFYFCFDLRFYLPVIIIMLVSCVLILEYIPKIFSKLSLLILLCGIYWQMDLIPVRNQVPLYRKNIESLKKHTTEDSIVLTNLNLPYLNLFFDSQSRKFIPISRRAEYASKIIMPKKNEGLLPSEIQDPFGHRHPKLLTVGIDPIKYVFLEDPEKLKEYMPDREVFLDLYSFPPHVANEYMKSISQHYGLVLIDQGIFKLKTL